jgi:hypothetical protein
LWPALLRYCDDGAIKIDNSAAERALRGIAIGRRNYLKMSRRGRPMLLTKKPFIQFYLT